MPYTPGRVSQDNKQLPNWLQQELQRISSSFFEPVTSIRLSPQAVEPEKVVVGTIVYADGTNWDPGAGSGVYLYGDSGWVKL